MAMIPEAFISELCWMLLSYAKEKAVKILGVPHEIKRLQRRLERIQGVLADAENKRFDNQAINRWLNELRDLMYDADDIIDDCRIEGEKFLNSNSSSSRCLESLRSCYAPIAFSHKVRFHHKIGKRIRDLNRGLDELAKDKDSLHLTLATHDGHYKCRISPKTSPVLVESDLVGEKIEDDTKRLVELLIKDHKKKFPIFAIVGMGGIGKTTLVQKIYNDEMLRDNFNHKSRIWLCISQDFIEIDLLRSVIQQVGGDPRQAKEKEVLEPMLSELVRNKKNFIVLDDVWDAQVWDKLLRNPLQSGLADGRILITTRNIKIAERMGAIYTHTVDKLSQEDGWSLICKIVFEEGNEHDMHDLRDIGMKIVEKCDGLPLTLKTVGGALRTKAKRQSEWDKVLSSQAWSFTILPNEEMGPLYLSYMDLPPLLKQCFTYLSLFPEDYLILKHIFVGQCIAEGFVTSKNNMLPENIAVGYWTELVQRNLLQPNPNYYDLFGCRMHDLLRSLGQHIAQDECFIGDARACKDKVMPFSSSSLLKLRHLSIVDGKLEAIPDLMTKQTSLRTLSFFHTPLVHDLPEDLFRKLRSLRVLNMSETAISNLPTSLGDLVHLRYLDLHATPIKQKPESIRNLRNLLFLILRDCKYLHSLPSSVMGLINLRVLSVWGTSLDGMPVGIGRLKQLQALWGFVENGGEGCRFGIGGDDREQEHQRYQHRRFCTLEELKSLSQLRYMRICNLERVSNRFEARADTLQVKSYLTFLGLHCILLTSSSDLQQPHANNYKEEEIKKFGEVFEELRPLPCLELLEIKGYFGTEFLSWMMTHSLSTLRNVRRVDLLHCGLCQQLPPMGMLPQLDFLRISGASSITSIGPEFLLLTAGGSVSARGQNGRKTTSCFSSYFPKLQTLLFEDMPNWKKWWWWWEEEDNQTTSLLPSLKILKINECPKLRSLPENLLLHATSLKELYIVGAHILREIQNLPYLKELFLNENSSLERVSNIPTLKLLHVYACEELKVVEGVDAVEHIELDDPKAESLPEWLVGASEE